MRDGGSHAFGGGADSAVVHDGGAVWEYFAEGKERNVEHVGRGGRGSEVAVDEKALRAEGGADARGGIVELVSVHHPGAEGENDGRFFARDEFEHSGRERAFDGAVKKREAGEADLRRPIGRRGAKPIWKHAEDELGREPVGEDAALRFQAERAAKFVERGADEAVAHEVERAIEKLMEYAWRPGGKADNGHDGRRN